MTARIRRHSLAVHRGLLSKSAAGRGAIIVAGAVAAGFMAAGPAAADDGSGAASPQTRVPAGNRACGCETPDPDSSVSAQQTSVRHDRSGSKQVESAHDVARSSTTRIVARDNADGSRTVSDQHGTSTFPPPPPPPAPAAAPAWPSVDPDAAAPPSAPAAGPAAPAPVAEWERYAADGLPIAEPERFAADGVGFVDPTKKWVDGAHEVLALVPRQAVKHPVARGTLEAATLMTDPRYSKQFGEAGLASDEGYSIPGDDGEPAAGSFRR